jgi:hypothetical protein
LKARAASGIAERLANLAIEPAELVAGHTLYIDGGYHIIDYTNGPNC